MTLPSAASSPRSSSKTPNRAIDRPTRNQAHRLASLSTSESHQGLFVVGQVQILHAFGGVPSHCPSISTGSFRTLLNPAVSIFASLAIPFGGVDRNRIRLCGHVRRELEPVRQQREGFDLFLGIQRPTPRGAFSGRAIMSTIYRDPRPRDGAQVP